MTEPELVTVIQNAIRDEVITFKLAHQVCIKDLNDRVAKLERSLQPAQSSVTPDGPLQHITVERAVEYVMKELGGGGVAYLRPINASGGPISTIPRHRFEEIITTALKSVCQPPQP